MIVRALLASLGLLLASTSDYQRAVPSIPRTRRSIGVASYIAWDYKISLRGLEKGSDAYKKKVKEVHHRSAELLLQLARANGGVFVKAGQFLSGLQEVPIEYRRTLSKLQDEAAPRPLHEVRQTLAAAMGDGFEARFASFAPVAAAAASLAQVHRAELRDGSLGFTAVAVKVQYAGLARQIAFDLRLLAVLTQTADRLFAAGFRTAWMVDRLSASLAEECDFRVEASNSERLAEVLAGRPRVRVPRVVFRSPTVLVTEWIDGVKVNDKAGLIARGLRPRDAADLLLCTFAELTLIHGLVHCDAHPGNLLVTVAPPRASPARGPVGRAVGAIARWARLLLGVRPRPLPELVLIDAGLITSLTEGQRRGFCLLYQAMHFGRGGQIRAAGVLLGATPDQAAAFPLLIVRSVTPAARKRMRAEAGIGGPRDVSTVLSTLPDPVLLVVRANANVRMLSSELGASQLDRLLPYARAAAVGLCAGERAAARRLAPGLLWPAPPQGLWTSPGAFALGLIGLGRCYLRLVFLQAFLTSRRAAEYLLVGGQRHKLAGPKPVPS